MADGATQQCGRVGSCHILLKPFSFLKGFFIDHNHRFTTMKVCTVVKRIEPVLYKELAIKICPDTINRVDAE
jgi:hypothetical protein